MTKKRFVNMGNDILQYGEWWCSANGEHCAEVIATALNDQNETITYLKEAIDSRDNEISELGKQRNYLVNENEALQLKIKMLEQVKPVKDIPKSIEVRF